MRARYDQERAPNRLPSRRLRPRHRFAKREPAHPGVHILGAIDFPSFLNVSIRRERLSYKAAHLLFIGRVTLDRLDNQAMRRATRLFGKGAKPCPQFWRQAYGCLL